MDNEADQSHCATCGEKLYGRHCHMCGEKKISLEDLTFKKFIEQAFDVITHFDSKMWKSVYLLFRKPGFLVTEHLEGRRVRYVKPVQLFIVINVIYFLVLNYIGFDEVTNPLKDHMNNFFYGNIATSLVNEKINDKNITFTEYENKFYDEIYVESKLLIIFMIPLLALWFMLIFFRKDILYYEQLIFSTYFFCFILLFHTFLNAFESVFDNNTAEIIVLFVSAIYLFFSIRKIHKLSKAEVILKTFLSVIGLILVVSIFRFLIFLTVYHTS